MWECSSGIGEGVQFGYDVLFETKYSEISCTCKFRREIWAECADLVVISL